MSAWMIELKSMLLKPLIVIGWKADVSELVPTGVLISCSRDP
jgi:hypothetical protein